MTQPEVVLSVDARYSSPYAMSVFVALTEKGIPFRMERVDLDAGQNFAPGFRQRSLTCRVPTLEHGGEVFSESSAIEEYLDEVFAPPAYPALYPRDPIQRARARQVQAWLRSDLMPIREERPTTVLFYAPTPKPLSDKARSAARKLFDAAQALLPDGAEHLFGAWSIADTDLALMLNRLVINGDEVPERLARYATAQWQRPSVQAWVGQSRPAK